MVYYLMFLYVKKVKGEVGMRKMLFVFVLIFDRLDYRLVWY